MKDYLLLLGAQQGFRILGIQTRRELDGPFFSDWWDSVSHLEEGFWDGDSPWIWNWFMHPFQGGVSYQMARTRGASRKEAVLWTFLYSTHFELAPLGEAGIGNVRVSPFDLVITPTLGPLFSEFESWLDSKLAHMAQSRKKTILRSILPVHAFTNLMRWRPPWDRSPLKK